MAATVSEELAQVEGILWLNCDYYSWLLLAVVIAGAMKLVGVLLITAMLIIPAAAARPFSQGPNKWQAIATVLSMFDCGARINLFLYEFDAPGRAEYCFDVRVHVFD